MPDAPEGSIAADGFLLGRAVFDTSQKIGRTKLGHLARTNRDAIVKEITSEFAALVHHAWKTGYERGYDDGEAGRDRAL